MQAINMASGTCLKPSANLKSMDLEWEKILANLQVLPLYWS